MSSRNGDPSRITWLWSRWREDLAVHHGNPFKPGFHVIALHRFGVWSRNQRGFVRWSTSKVYTLAHLLLSSLYGVELPREAVVGRRLRLPHPVGIIVSHDTRIGDDCMIRQNVTLGQHGHVELRTSPRAPTIGNGVSIGAGAVIVGNVTIGDGARIGPNAVVMMDVPPGGRAVTRPARLFHLEGGLNMMPNTTERTASLDERKAGDVHDLIELLGEVVRPQHQQPVLIEANTPLISTGIIDSFGVTALLAAIEDHYGVSIEPEDIDVDRFDTPHQMLEQISRHRGS